jgi:hypothetical protein
VGHVVVLERVPSAFLPRMKMHPTFATLSMAMLAGALVVGSMIGLGRKIGGMRSWAAIVAAASVVGSLFGSAMVHAAIDHNPQQAFVNHATGAVAYGHLAGIFLSWFLAANVTVSLGFAAVLGLLKGSEALYRTSRR